MYIRLLWSFVCFISVYRNLEQVYNVQVVGNCKVRVAGVFNEVYKLENRGFPFLVSFSI